VNPDLGRPAYTDVYARFAHRLTPDLKASANLLIFNDDLEVFDSDQEEEARAEYRDEYYWAALDWDAGNGLGVRGQVARTLLSSERTGTADLPGVGRGSLKDRRQFTIDTLTVDGRWSPRPAWELQAGMEWRAVEGQYVYADQAQFDLLFLGVDAPHEPVRERRLALRPQGHHYAAYASWRLEATDQLTADLGLRWDRETLSPGGSEALFPRLGLFWQPVPGTRLRGAWGRFFQAQGIDEAAVSDGDPRFYRGQKAEHYVFGVEHSLSRSLDLRFEAYRKQYGDLRPRHENLLNTLVVLPELKPDRIRIDPRSARADGIELTLSFERGPTSGWMNYGWSTVEDHVVDRNAPRNWDQKHFVGLGGSYKGDRGDITLAASWHSGGPTTALELQALDPVPLVHTGPRNAVRLGSYLRLDTHVARRFELSTRQRLTVFFDVNNVSNRRNQCCVEYQIESDAPDPYLDVGPLDSLPIIPSLGVVWEF